MDVCYCFEVLNCPRARLHLYMSTTPPVPTGNISIPHTVPPFVLVFERGFRYRVLDVDCGLRPNFGAAHTKVGLFIVLVSYLLKARRH